ncbi:DUF3885 domain-containing protein [Planococcus wigleyi]|uniref:DUF3885 domain-containing protein n=1 Tax=Planococcus wigleyi TaxID=2762216 RepID=A0ABR8WC38_9BACL|nr:DUF3885 domain-containing protein [Planococcus wigleyi]MBD8014590.1 DUF3885 domain-containing protein [Planococcus wigleyi]
MNLQDYLHTTFPGLVLRPSLYLQWKIGIHFELGLGIYQFEEGDKLNMHRFENAYKQTLAIFNDLFSEEDELVLVTNVYHQKNANGRTKPFKVYKNGVKNKKLTLQLKLNTLPYVFDEEEEADDYYTAQYQLKCKKHDLRYHQLIQAACNEDFPLKPKFRREKGMYYPDTFFINLTKNTIFFIYDDRGCEVIAADKETLRPLYEKYAEWLYEYNRDDMKQLFS